MKQSSLFDIISPIMVGPSSSHTAGAVRLGILASNIYGATPKKVTFKLYNSYAQTGKGHGTDKGLLAGVLGFSVEDVRIKNIFDLPEAKEIQYKFEFLEDFNRHPNAVDFIFEGTQKMIVSGNSIGAGNVEITKINGFSVKLSGEYNSLVVIYKDKPGMISKISGLIQTEGVNIATLVCDRTAKGEDASMCICLDAALNYSVIEKIKKIDDMYVVRHVGKLES
ncbi:MAG: L-serine ammonia-lyase, iron-sulfur-dependent subunit beta [Candidatus Gastranaerophilales bacterium]|nr:L-serine ammonia-lyase, iron-sulfur-dependent subunit beta [Candidatus Gastranaerophilales bacterium]